MARIVVGVDGFEVARVALGWAIGEAEIRSASVEAVLAFDLLEPPRVEGRRVMVPDWTEEAAAALVEREVKSVTGDRSVVEVTKIVETANPAPLLLERAQGADLLVVGTRGLGHLEGLVLGSVAQSCLAHATVPVATVPPGVPTGSEGPVVVGIDGSAHSLAALRWAADEARFRHRPFEVVYAMDFPSRLDFWEVPSEENVRPTVEERLAACVRDVAGDLSDLEVTLDVAEESPATALLRRGAEAGLIVIGARGRGGFVGLLTGSTTTQVAGHAACPVVVVRSDG